MDATREREHDTMPDYSDTARDGKRGGKPHTAMTLRVALYQPDIPQNTAAVLRVAACLGVAVDLIEPAGFVLDDRRLRRVAMDYLDHVDLVRHRDWKAFLGGLDSRVRLVLLTTRGDMSHLEFNFGADDVILLGRESAGVPDAVHARADARVYVPMVPEVRSLNVVTAATLALGEALRQTGTMPTG